MASEIPPKVLFIEDDIGKRYVIARAMRSAGFEVDEATTGQEGLAKVSPALDLVVLDIRLPDMLGWDVATRIKSAPATSTVMILELSATLATAQDRARGLDRGADAYLVHPVETVELLAVMRALVRLRQSERERERHRELFLATVGHDLRNPLGVLTTGIAVLGASRDLSPPDRDTVAKLARTGERMQHLLDQLLIFSQGVAGGVPIDAAPALLGEVCRDAIRDIEAGTREIAVEDHLGIPVTVDRRRMGQVVENLVTNALRHGEGTVIVRLSREGDTAALAVHNAGAPIAPESIATLFDPYRRAASSAGGLGLGLFIVDQIARAHRGAVTVTSTADGGTTFEVRIPVA